VVIPQQSAPELFFSMCQQLWFNPAFGSMGHGYSPLL
jgi:hypothetical protein